jgi:hypothetical protein
MSLRACSVGIAALALAASAGAQERGTIEFGAFTSVGFFDKALTLNTGYGIGGRVGAYLVPRWSMEFEKAEMRASRTNGLKDVNVGILAGRLVGVPFKAGALSVLLGGGAGVSTETNFMHSYGVDGLVGMKLALNPNTAFRIDGTWDWLANEHWKTYRSVRMGLTVYRTPNRRRDPASVAATPVVSTPPAAVDAK